MMYAKDSSVNPTGMRPELMFGLQICGGLLYTLHYPLVITSLNDDDGHSRTSLHYDGRAADFRSRHMQEAHKRDFLDRANQVLHKNFDLLLEKPGEPKEHFHLEWQPKRP